MAAKKAERLLAKVRTICTAMPGVDEDLAHGHASFRVGKKRFAYFLDNHHGDGRIAIWCKAPPGAQAMAVDADPERIFVPPYLGPRGWVGVRLDRDLDWSVVAAFLRDAYDSTAPKRRPKRA